MDGSSERAEEREDGMTEHKATPGDEYYQPPTVYGEPKVGKTSLADEEYNKLQDPEYNPMANQASCYHDLAVAIERLIVVHGCNVEVLRKRLEFEVQLHEPTRGTAANIANLANNEGG